MPGSAPFWMAVSNLERERNMNIEGHCPEGSFNLWREGENLHCAIRKPDGQLLEVTYWNDIPVRMVKVVREATEKLFPRRHVPNTDPAAQGFRPTNPDSCSNCTPFAE